MSQKRRKEEIIDAMMDVEFYPSVELEDMDDVHYRRIPFGALADLGVAAASLPDVCRKVTESVNVGGNGLNGLYYCTAKKGVTGKLAVAKDGSGQLAEIMGDNGFVGQMRLHKVEHINKEIVVPYDPTMLFMGVALLSMENQLNKIMELQREMMAMLKEKDLAELKAGLLQLTEINNSYKFNWNDEAFTRVSLNQVENQKAGSRAQMEFYMSRIRKLLQKKEFIYTNQEMRDLRKKLDENFRFYRFALFVYTYAEFLEVMLVGNFSEEYLKFVENNLESDFEDYQLLYRQGRRKITGYGKKAIEKQALSGAAAANKVAGKAIAKIPLLEKGPLDEVLISAGDKIEDFSSRGIDKTLEKFRSYEDPGTSKFLDSIKIADTLYNRPMELLFDNEYLYIPKGE